MFGQTFIIICVCVLLVQFIFFNFFLLSVASSIMRIAGSFADVAEMAKVKKEG